MMMSWIFVKAVRTLRRYVIPSLLKGRVSTRGRAAESLLEGQTQIRLVAR